MPPVKMLSSKQPSTQIGDRLFSSSRDFSNRLTQRLEQMNSQTHKGVLAKGECHQFQESCKSNKDASMGKGFGRPFEDSSARVLSALFNHCKGATRNSANATDKLQKRLHPLPFRPYKSPEKIPSKVKISRELLRKSNLEPVRVDQSGLTDKAKIVHNLFDKQGKFFYSSRVSVRSLVRSIYYNCQSVDNMDDFLHSAFKRLAANQEFFNVIYEESKVFSSTVSKSITDRIGELVEQGQDSSISFVPLISNVKRYKRVVDELYDHFLHLFQVHSEVERLTHKFVEFYFERHNHECEGFNFYSKLFVCHVFKNQLVSSFMESLCLLFEESPFLKSGYAEMALKISELYLYSKRFIDQITSSTPFLNSSASTNCGSVKNGCPKGVSVRDPRADSASQDENLQNNNALKTQIQKMRELQNQNATVQDQNEHNQSTNDRKVAEQVAKKKKKKKNKKREIKNEENQKNQSEDDTQHFSQAERLFLEGFEVFLTQVDNTYAVPASERIRVEFDADENEVFQTLAL